MAQPEVDHGRRDRLLDDVRARAQLHLAPDAERVDAVVPLRLVGGAGPDGLPMVMLARGITQPHGSSLVEPDEIEPPLTVEVGGGRDAWWQGGRESLEL